MTKSFSLQILRSILRVYCLWNLHGVYIHLELDLASLKLDLQINISNFLYKIRYVQNNIVFNNESNILICNVHSAFSKQKYKIKILCNCKMINFLKNIYYLVL